MFPHARDEARGTQGWRVWLPTEDLTRVLGIWSLAELGLFLLRYQCSSLRVGPVRGSQAPRRARFEALNVRRRNRPR